MTLNFPKSTWQQNQVDIYPSSSLSAGDERAPERGGPGAPVQSADALAREDVLEAARQVALLLHVLARVRRLQAHLGKIWLFIIHISNS